MSIVPHANPKATAKPSAKNGIMAWNTDLPIICSPFESTYNIAKSMAAKKNNCAIVKDFSRNKIIGIFTAKDLAFKVVSKGLHPQLLKAKDIMTPSPICATADEPASSALNKMIKYKIRHLPVIDYNDDVVGMLDITKCFNQTLGRLRKLRDSSQKLNEALMEVQENIANMPHDDDNVNKHSEMYYQAQDMVLKAKNNISNMYQHNLALTGDKGEFEDFEMLLNLMESPTLQDVLNVPNHPQTLFIDANNTIRSASDIMKKNNTTAVLVRDTTTSTKSVIGILTTKDIVYRVLAQDHEPDFTIITRVMTPSPEFGDSNMGIVDALEVMYNGHFLNLPVTDDMHNVVGIVSVLQLTNMALLQLQRGIMDEENNDEMFNNPYAANPKWDRFWGVMDINGNNFEDETLRSDYSIRSNGPPALKSPTKSSISIHNSNLKKKSSIQSPKVSSGKYGSHQSTRSIASNTFSNHIDLSAPRDNAYYFDDADETGSIPTSEISPEDSISCYIAPESEVNSIVLYASDLRRQSGTVPGPANSIVRALKQSFMFKLRDLDNGSRVHKIKIMLPKTKTVLPHLRSAIEDKLHIDATQINLSYIDEDEDVVAIDKEDDLKASIEMATANKKSTITVCLTRKLIQDNAEMRPQALEDVSKLRSKFSPGHEVTTATSVTATGNNAIADLLQKPEVIISGALFTLSLGILLGITLSRQK